MNCRHSVLPVRYASSERWPTFLVVYLPGQLFGAYEFGQPRAVGPVSSGRRSNPTSAGQLRLELALDGTGKHGRSGLVHAVVTSISAIAKALAFHEYSLPGYPASHGCIRLLDTRRPVALRMGTDLVLDASGTRVLTPGTPVFIVGRYDFDAPPPWRSLTWLSHTVALPSAFLTAIPTP